MKYGIHMRAIWAVDPNEKNDSALHHRARKVIRRLLEASAESQVEPVYVFRVSSAVTPDIGSMWRKDLVRAAEESLRAFLRHTKIPGLSPPRVLVSGASSYRRAAILLADHAGSAGADLIVAQTHGRSGLGRVVLGSFAETLLLLARTPVLLVNPKTRIKKAFDTILFPTDFGPTAADQLRDVLDLARRFGAKVTLFHGLESDNEALLLSSMSGPLPVLSGRHVDRAAHARKHAEAWIRVARRRGIEMDFVLRERSKSSADSIIDVARKIGAALIAMQTNTGAVGAVILGSTTRNVIRKAPCPVWVLKPSPRVLIPKIDSERVRTRELNYTSDRLKGEISAR